MRVPVPSSDGAPISAALSDQATDCPNAPPVAGAGLGPGGQAVVLQCSPRAERRRRPRCRPVRTSAVSCGAPTTTTWSFAATAAPNSASTSRLRNTVLGVADGDRVCMNTAPPSTLPVSSPRGPDEQQRRRPRPAQPHSRRSGRVRPLELDPLLRRIDEQHDAVGLPPSERRPAACRRLAGASDVPRLVIAGSDELGHRDRPGVGRPCPRPERRSRACRRRTARAAPNRSPFDARRDCRSTCQAPVGAIEQKHRARRRAVGRRADGEQVAGLAIWVWRTAIAEPKRCAARASPPTARGLDRTPRRRRPGSAALRRTGTPGPSPGRGRRRRDRSPATASVAPNSAVACGAATSSSPPGYRNTAPESGHDAEAVGASAPGAPTATTPPSSRATAAPKRSPLRRRRAFEGRQDRRADSGTETAASPRCSPRSPPGGQPEVWSKGTPIAASGSLAAMRRAERLSPSARGVPAQRLATARRGRRSACGIVVLVVVGDEMVVGVVVVVVVEGSGSATSSV